MTYWRKRGVYKTLKSKCKEVRRYFISGRIRICLVLLAEEVLNDLTYRDSSINRDLKSSKISEVLEL